MTIQDILAMKPGRELDKLVHARFFPDQPASPVPAYSTSLKCFQLVTKMPLTCGRAALNSEHYSKDRPYFAHHPKLSVVRSATLACAICKAALISAIEYDTIPA